MISQWGIIALCVLGLVRWFRKLDDPLTSLVGVSVLGILISVPFLPPTDAYRMRPYAASMIVFGLLPALGLFFGMEALKVPLPTNGSRRCKPRYAGGVYFPFGFRCFAGTACYKSLAHPPQFDQSSCAPGSDMISVRFDRGIHFNILREKQSGLDWMPISILGVSGRTPIVCQTQT